MASVEWDRVKEIIDAFHAEEPDRPEAWLAARCGDNSALRQEVESLLRADREGRLSDQDRAADRLSIEGARTEDRAGEDLSSPPPVEAGGTVGRYRLLEEIGVGGMSVVYRAERADGAFEQTVAVKLLQRRLHGGDAADRFRTERQVLASLDHPGIAQLIDGGVAEDGRPYLVMEYVDGEPITEYADGQALDLEARLDLLRQVTDAVQAAHRQLVVHRDLKPSNVLVTETDDGTPQVKLLDFGIAKLLGDTMPVTHPETRTGRQLLTPAYAAPEQVTGGDISTQTDVYQLGALAYELLAGARPFDLDGQSPTEVERIITEEPPAAPSSRAGGTDPPIRFSEDLDTIVLKALRKEPERRYSSVEALTEDLRRYRAGEPVEARPATLRYRAQKFVQRNAQTVAGIAVFGVAVVGLTAFYIFQISEERNRAQREAQKAEAVAGYLTDLLQSTRPDEAGGDTVTAADMLRRGRKRIDRLSDQPAVQARMLQLLGNAHRERANYQRAASLLRRSLSIRDSLYGPAHRSIANTLEELAALRQERGHLHRADSLWQKALQAQKRRFGPNSPKLWEPLNNRGRIASREGRLAEADSLYRTALSVERSASAPDSGHLATTINNLADVQHQRGQSARADSLWKTSLAMKRRIHDAPHPEIATGMLNLGFVRSEEGRRTEADSLFTEALSMYRSVYESPHPSIATALQNLGSVRAKQERHDDAGRLLKEALSMFRSIHEGPHPSIAAALNGLGEVRTRQGDLSTADSLLRRSAAMVRKTLGGQHPWAAYGLMNRGDIRVQQGRFSDAATLYRRAWSILRDRFPDDHARVAEAEAGLGQALAELNRFRKAEPLLKHSLQVFQDKGKEERAQEVRADLAELYAAWGKPKRAAAVHSTRAEGSTE
jgi:serine/threonine-protein kinase